MNKACGFNIESQEQLIKTRDIEKRKACKLHIILNLLKQTNEISNIKAPMKMLTFQNYIRVFEDNGFLLGLKNCKNVEVSYTERKTIRSYIIEKIFELYRNIEPFANKLYEDFPELFEDSSQQTTKKDILDLDSKRREIYLNLSEVRNKKIALLKSIVELKVGPYIKNEIEIILEGLKMQEIKASVLQGYFAKEFMSRTNHAVKAIKEVSRYVDASIEDG